MDPYLVPSDTCGEGCVALRVHVICPDKYPLFPCRHGKWPDTSHNIAYYLPGLEKFDQSSMLGFELGVPVYLGVVELEDAVVFAQLDVQVVRTSQDLVLEGSKLGLLPNVVCLVNDRLDVWILVYQDFCYYLLVWLKSTAQV